MHPAGANDRLLGGTQREREARGVLEHQDAIVVIPCRAGTEAKVGLIKAARAPLIAHRDRQVIHRRRRHATSPPIASGAARRCQNAGSPPSRRRRSEWSAVTSASLPPLPEGVAQVRSNGVSLLGFPTATGSRCERPRSTANLPPARRTSPARRWTFSNARDLCDGLASMRQSYAHRQRTAVSSPHDAGVHATADTVFRCARDTDGRLGPEPRRARRRHCLRARVTGSTVAQPSLL